MTTSSAVIPQSEAAPTTTEVDQYLDLEHSIKQAQLELDAQRDRLIARMKATGIRTAEGSHGQVTLVEQSQREVDVLALRRYVTAAIFDYISHTVVPVGKVDALVESGVLRAEDLALVVTSRDKRPFLNITRKAP